MPKRFDQENEQIIIHTDGMICSTSRDVLGSPVFQKILGLYVHGLERDQSPLLEMLDEHMGAEDRVYKIADLLWNLVEHPLEQVAKVHSYAGTFLNEPLRENLHEFVENFYDFWRAFDRFMVLHSEPGPSSHDQRPYRAFNETVEALSHLIRGVYRDICENITGDHPRIYRQVAAGCDVGMIAVPKQINLPPAYARLLDAIPFVRQVWISPPMIIDPPMNTRTGRFERVDRNPLDGMKLHNEKWICYPAQVGPLVIFVYFHQRFIGLGSTLANLFEVATDEQIATGPDAIYLFGAPPESLAQFGDLPTVFFDDEENNLLVAAVPLEDRFGYFGYLKKMVLTLHNIIAMKRNRMPYHGAMVRVDLKNGASANVLLLGDTATGKSESLEALRLLGKGIIRRMRIIADDMGSLDIDAEGRAIGYGTEIGAFIRLDDLQQGYAFEQIDRAIIMSPQKVNARVVLPVTTMSQVLHGYPIDILLYANNYEQVDADHGIIGQFSNVEQALAVFREGAAMAKGTTSSTGLVHSYFANIFGPPQYRDLHDQIAQRTFQAAFDSGTYVGQLRTRLAIPGMEANGPKEAAKALLDLISSRR